jgi:hypothetical protein
VKIDTSGRFGAEVVIDGLEPVLNGLEEIDPKLRRGLNREIKQAVDTVAQAAGRQIDSRSGETAAGYKVRRRGNSFRVVNSTRGAAILEFAAVPKCPQGVSLVNTLNEKYGKPGRILWDSWDTMAPFVTDRLRQLVDDAAIELERRTA